VNVNALDNTSFLSLGLDIGTTTTHLVISRLTLGPGEDPFGRHHLLEKEIVHRSEILFTPFDSSGLVDVERIHASVMREYARAGVKPADVLTGAVIVTGETALKANAEQVVQRLAGESSSFAAAVAGANQESILAGRGSGAAEHSRRHRCCTLNVDIGGGTSNLAWFVNGEAVAASAIRVGGRHLVRNSDAGVTRDGEYAVVSQTAERLLGTTRADASAAQRWIAECVRAFEQAIEGNFAAIAEPFVVTRPASVPPSPDIVFYSGGVADLMSAIEQDRPLPDGFGDTGELLARALLSSSAVRNRPVQYPAEPIRATVIGAGQFSIDFSGETLWADADLLPLRNLPVLRLPRHLHELPDAEAIASAIVREQTLRSLEPGQPAAVVLPDLRQADWDTVVRFATALAEAADRARLASPWVFTMRDNFGRLLGRTLAEHRPQQPLVVIDEIDAGEADYLDIGRPVQRFRMVIPVVAKSLIFEK